MNTIVPSSNPEELTIIPGKLNHDSTPDDGIFLLSGNAAFGNVSALIPPPGVELPGPGDALAGNGFHLTIYHLNDLHGQLAHLTPEGETPVLARIAYKIRKQRRAVKDVAKRGVMFFSTGDDLIGSIFDELLITDQNEFQTHASFQLFSALDMDGGCMGNHDFDMGLDLLKTSILEDAQFPIFAANLHCPDLEEVYHPGAIYRYKGIRIGVIGLVTQAEQKLAHLDCMITDPLPVARNLVALLHPHCDALIILSHLGYSLENATVPIVNAGDVELAKSLPHGSVDLIIGGHSHHELNTHGLNPKNVVNGIPIVQSGSSGRFLGEVDLKISTNDTAVFQVRLIPVETIPVDTAFNQSVVSPLIEKARELFDQTLGVTTHETMLIGDQVSSSCEGIEIPMQNILRIANFITDALVTQVNHAGLFVDLAMIDSSSLQKGLPEKTMITYGDWFNVMPYADTLRIFTLTGEELLDLLNDNARRVDLPNEPRIDRGFLHFSKELSYIIEIGSHRKNAHAIEATFKGIPVYELLTKEFRIVSTDFVRQYCTTWEDTDPDYDAGLGPDLRHQPYQDTGLYIRRELINYINQIGAVTEETGAVCDDRVRVLHNEPAIINHMTLSEFAQYVSKQGHAMAGAVTAISAAQALALGQACLSISGLNNHDKNQNRLVELQDHLLDIARQDANAISRLVAISKKNEHDLLTDEIKVKAALCRLPVEVAKMGIEAAQILQEGRSFVIEKVQDDLEISIRLLYGAIQAAILLIDSNLRIWPEADLLAEYQPVLDALREEISTIIPAEHIRTPKTR